MSDTSVIRKALEEQKAVLGAKRTHKLLRASKVAQVFLTNNASAYVKEDTEHYCNLTGTPLVHLDINNKELGVLCKKPFVVSVMCIAK